MEAARQIKIVLLFGFLLIALLIFPFAKNIWDTRALGSKNIKKIASTLGTSVSYKQVMQVVTPTRVPTAVPTQYVAISNLVTATGAITPSTSLVTQSPTNTPTPTQLTSSTIWTIKSIDAMKDTKDAVCGPRSEDWINKWLDKAVELGANYVAVATPYDSPACASALEYTKTWVQAIRSHGLHVWHRHMPLAFEGIYDTSKNNSTNFLDMIRNYITQNPDLFEPGDIVTPIPEPQNGGIQGVTNCANSVCQFSSAAAFNQWLRDAMSTTQDALSSIGKSGQLKVGYFGFDGFVAWGDNNPDWHGILEDSTISAMGNITIDHYPELVHESMSQGLSALSAKYPNIPIVIGEWGTVTGGNTVQQIQDDMTAVKNDAQVTGFNYWQFGPQGSGEQLIDDTFNELPGFAAVEGFYK